MIPFNMYKGKIAFSTYIALTGQVGRMRKRIVNEFLPLLKEKEKDENLRISEAVEKPGTNPGENYMSIVTRTKIGGKRGDGRTYERSFITKRFPCDPEFIARTRIVELFRNEAYVYQKLLPRLGLGSLAPECIHADPEKIIFEDLRQEQYSLRDRRSLLDLEHSMLVIQTLASFHAKSLSMKLENPVEFKTLMEPITEVFFPPDSKPATGQSFNDGVIKAIKLLSSDDPRPREVEVMIEFLRNNCQGAYEQLRNFITTKGKYNVITHGDVWNNNILFRSGTEDGENLSLKFVDFQAVRHASPATDFHYFVYSSTKSSVIEENYEKLVEHYHTSFLNELRQLGVQESDCQSMNIEWFREELSKYAMYGLLTSLNLVNAIFASRKPSTIEPTENGQQSSVEVPPETIAREKTERIKFIMSHFLSTYKK